MQINLDNEDLEPLIRKIVAEVVEAIGTDKPERLLSEPEAAATFSVEAHTLRDARKRGELKFHRIGRYVRYDQEQLEDWKAHTQQ